MPGFELEQVDGGSPIELPCGETVLGRGPFLGVNDKRVSRNHGILENRNGQLRLKPTHLNPCFIQTNIVSASQPLEKDQWHCLKEGDIFSLMPGKYVYRVRVKEEDQTLRNSQAFEEEMNVEKCLTGPAELSEDNATLNSNSCAPTSPSSTLTGDKGAGASSHTLCSLTQVPIKSQHGKSDLPQKKRILPAWMMSSVTTSPSTTKAVRATPIKPKRVATPKRATGPRRARAAQLSSEEEEPEEKMPKRTTKRLKSDSEEELVPLDDAAAPKSSGVRTVPDGENGTDLMERDGGYTRGAGRGAEVRRGSQAEDSKTQAEDPSDSQVSQGPSQRSKIMAAESKTSNSKVKKQRRTPCSYGSSCYRKNPLHFQECSHPGDSDYEDEEEEDADDDDDRPECPYGTHCYRKNPLHKKEYKHTKSPPKTAADEEDEDHYENSFINDESDEEEVDEDSDYVPESDGSGKEDIKRLQKEAKVFLRRKK